MAGIDGNIEKAERRWRRISKLWSQISDCWSGISATGRHDTSTNDRHPRGSTSRAFVICLHPVLVAVDTLFPDPVDRFLDVRDADWGCDLGLGGAL